MRWQIAQPQTQSPHLREIGYLWTPQEKQNPLLGIMENLAAQDQSIDGAALNQERESGILNK
jgi:hypothetical protein